MLLTECKYWDVDDTVGKMKNVCAFLAHTLADASSPICRAGVTRANQVTLLFALFRVRGITSEVKTKIETAAMEALYEFGVALITKEGPTLVPLFEFQSADFDQRCATQSEVEAA